MKILHTADLHLGDLNGPTIGGKNARRLDTLKCAVAIAEEATRHAINGERIDLAIIAGDLFNRSRVWADTALEDITDAITEFIRPLCRACDQVVLLFGTENHDNPLAFDVIRQTTQDEKNLHIITTPQVITLATNAGEIQVMGVPGFDKGRLRAFFPDADKELENRNATALINEITLGLATTLDKSKPSILTAHYTVAGSEADNGTTFLAGQDVVILPQTIDATGVNLACFGHIHRPQRIQSNTPAYYCGSPNQLTFNDEGDEHGFWIHELDEQGSITSGFVPTPERKHLTIRFDQTEIEQFIASGTLPECAMQGWPEDAIGSIVRVRYKATAEQDKALNRAELQRQLLTWGAFHVAEILPEDLDESVDAYEEMTDDSPAAMLHRYLETAKEPGDIERLEELAAPLIRKADDGREADQHVGAFAPRRVEVKNYRSYTAAAFDFSDIRMAMVNGQNGVGKSSLFMDAIADCLFESSRDEEVGGWLRQGEKSGAVTFEFDMGETEYRVTRTRTKSGKGTLAFNRKADSGEWEDCGDTTMKLTQGKIEKTLGMDCQTFCSVALIRQDAYGLFLEADSDRRMEVLSALLNLGVFVRLEDLAKAEASEQRKRIASLKDRMGVLNEQMETRGAVETELADVNQRTADAAQRITELDSQIATAQREEALRQEVIRRADEKEREAQTLEQQATEKADTLFKIVAECDEARALSEMKDTAEAAAQTVTAARKDLETLAAAEADLRSLTERRSSLLGNKGNIENGLKANELARQGHTDILAQREEINAAVTAMQDIKSRRAELDHKAVRYRKGRQAVNDLQARVKDWLAESRERISGIEHSLKTAQQKAALLNESNCPIADTATCAFLKDAQEAKALVGELTASLATTKNDDRAEYELRKNNHESAQEALTSLGDPLHDIELLAKEEAGIAPLAALAPKLEAAAASLALIDRQEREQREALEGIEAELAGITEQLPPLEEQAQQAAKLREDIRANEPTANLLTRATAAAATVSALGERIRAMEKDIETARQSAQEARRAAQDIREGIDIGETNIDALAQEKRQREAFRTTLDQQAGGLKGKLEAIAAAAAQWEQYRDEAQTVARTLNDYQSLAVAFGIDGIQYMIIRSIVPEIQHRANDILAAMTGGRMAVDFRTEREQKSNQKIVNSLDVWIVSLNGGSRPYSSHSGGEKVKIALAVTLALADIKARRAGAQLGMLFIDEPPFLDADGTEAYADALGSIAARNPAMRILAISHDPAMKARFPQNIIITAGENGSEVARE